ncbi:MAG TPA: dienelactone hydrolase [Desulfovibrio sp.]|nr:dienelactone hydrolase [Desulfovibrio sp.]
MVRQRIVQHEHPGTALESILLLPEGKGPYPAVLLFHEYTGLNSVTIGHAKRLAETGYAVLAADFYGLENRPVSIAEARATHRIYRNDRLLMRERAEACFEILCNQPEIDLFNIYVLGFSFGGGAALELTRTGVFLKGSASVYGYLDTSHPVVSRDVKCPLLVIHVDNDPVVPAEHLAMFEDEMQSAGVDYDLIRLDNATHGFANPEDDGFDVRLAEDMWDTVLRWFDILK